MRRQENERQAKIKEGNDRIEEIFAPYFGKQAVRVANPAYRDPNAPPPKSTLLTFMGPLGPMPVGGGTTGSYSPSDRGGVNVSGMNVNQGSPIGNSVWARMLGLADVPKTLLSFKQVGPESEFFDKAKDDYLSYYMPQFDRQEQEARRRMIVGLSRSGNLDGSVGQKTQADFSVDATTNRQRIIDEALKYSQGIRSNIEQTKGNLRSQLEAGSGVENIAAQAAAQANALTAPAAFSPLGELFKNYTGAVANSTIAQGDPRFPNAEAQRRALLFNIPSSGSRGSSTIVS